MKKLASDISTYFADVHQYARMYPWALFRPRVVRGHFSDKEHHRYQEIFFNILLGAGFTRTSWQLVFPGQIAGLIKRIPPRVDGANEYHVRFYDDGTIDCELEHHRFHLRHWTGARQKSTNFLEDLLDQHGKHFSAEARQRVRLLFGTKEWGI